MLATVSLLTENKGSVQQTLEMMEGRREGREEERKEEGREGSLTLPPLHNVGFLGEARNRGLKITKMMYTSRCAGVGVFPKSKSTELEQRWGEVLKRARHHSEPFGYILIMQIALPTAL